MLEWETLLPDMGLFPVIWHTLDMIIKILEREGRQTNLKAKENLDYGLIILVSTPTTREHRNI